VPEGRRLRLRLFEEFHDSKMGGHFGQEKTYLQLSRRFYWPDMEASIRRYVKGCDLCLRTKARQHAPFGLLEALDIPQERWKQVGIDFITKLPTTPSGNNAIVTIIDHLTKRAHFIPTTDFRPPSLNGRRHLHGSARVNRSLSFVAPQPRPRTETGIAKSPLGYSALLRPGLSDGV
jgi:hypothetical protein